MYYLLNIAGPISDAIFWLLNPMRNLSSLAMQINLNDINKLGRRKYFEDRGVYLNPYPPGSSEFNEFERGWMQALKQDDGRFFKQSPLSKHLELAAKAQVASPETPRKLVSSTTGKESTRMLHPQSVKGPWKAGVVLDWHTVASQVIGQNEFGHPVFDNTRSEIGELLYQFKYRGDQTALQKILGATVEYLSKRANDRFELIVPVPPSNPTRTVTSQLAKGLASGLGVGFSATALVKVKNTDELKSVSDPVLRKQVLENAFFADNQEVASKAVLLVDDLYRSGATLEAATAALITQGGAKSVYVLAVTRTRVHR